jgi:hypothetical protein
VVREFESRGRAALDIVDGNPTLTSMARRLVCAVRLFLCLADRLERRAVLLAISSPSTLISVT